MVARDVGQRDAREALGEFLGQHADRY